MTKKAKPRRKTKAARHGRQTPNFGNCPYTHAELFMQGMQHDIDNICDEIDEAFDFVENKK